jgi:hypothetical protein
MKNLVKNTIATLILLTCVSLNVFADGEMQCPKTAAPCLFDSTTNTKIDKKQELDFVNEIIIKMFSKFRFLF